MYKFNVFVETEDNFYIAHNLELWIVSQGLSYEEAIENLKEASELYLEDEISIFTKIKNKKYLITNITI